MVIFALQVKQPKMFAHKPSFMSFYGEAMVCYEEGKVSACAGMVRLINAANGGAGFSSGSYLAQCRELRILLHNLVWILYSIESIFEVNVPSILTIEMHKGPRRAGDRSRRCK